jgi:hypothetical protein
VALRRSRSVGTSRLRAIGGSAVFPLSRLQSAVQRAQRWGAEPDLPAQTSRRRDIIAFVVFCRLRYRLILRDLSEIMALRAIEISHEAVQDWEAKLVPVVGDALRKRRHGTRRGAGVSWYIDETYLKVRGQWVYLYRSIDGTGT